MLTSCPECRTTFRVTQVQLDAKRGLVRCGHCNAVFNAYDALLPEIEMPPVEAQEQAKPVAEKPQATEVRASAERLEPRIDLGFDLSEPMLETVSPPAPIQPEPKPESKPEPLPWLEPKSEPAPEPFTSLPAYSTAPIVDDAEPMPTWLSLAEQADDVLLSELPAPKQASGLARLGRGLLLVLLPLAFTLQLVFFGRSELAAWQPALRPYLEAACAPLHCTVPLPRDRDALRVESSSLETDPESPANARLRVAFSNRAERPMAWPNMVLTLTDLRDKTLAQRGFAPRDYLADKGLAKQGIAPGQEFEVLLDLNLGGLAAAGYRVALEYP